MQEPVNHNAGIRPCECWSNNNTKYFLHALNRNKHAELKLPVSNLTYWASEPKIETS